MVLQILQMEYLAIDPWGKVKNNEGFKDRSNGGIGHNYFSWN